MLFFAILSGGVAVFLNPGSDFFCQFGNLYLVGEFEFLPVVCKAVVSISVQVRLWNLHLYESTI